MNATKEPKPTGAPKYQRRQLDASSIASGKKLLDTARTCDFLSISDDTLDKLLSDPEEGFPKPVELVRGKRHWPLEDLEKYVAKKQKRASQGDRR